MNDYSKFFDHGSVSVLGIDETKRKTILSLVIPYSLLFNVTTTMLKHGSFSELRVNDPMTVWQPDVGSFIKPDYTKDNPQLAHKINESLKTHIESYMLYLADICHILQDPSIIGTSIPNGVYVSVKFTTDIDRLPNILEELQAQLNVVGIAEFQLALAAGLSKILKLIA